MATYATTVRRGLPRTRGGEPWPPAGDVPAAIAARVSAGTTGASAPPVQASPPALPVEPEAVSPVTDVAAATPSSAPAARRAASVRRGLPRTPGGEPWPPADFVAAATAAQPAADAAAQPAAAPAPTPDGVETAAAPGSVVRRAMSVRRGLPRTPGGEPWPPADFVAAATAAQPAADAAAQPAAAPAPTPDGVETAAAPGSVVRRAMSVRRGLPRTPGGEPWPPADFAASAVVTEVAPTSSEPAPTGEAVAVPAGPDVSTPLGFTPTVTPGKYAFARPEPAPEPKRYGPFTMGQWVGAVLVGGAALLVAAAMVVLLVRWLVSLPFMQDFLAAYPGEYHLPESAPVGFPAWLNWQHFLNVFLMVLIIRSGLQVRHQKRPEAFWSPRWNKGRKISIMLWFHQSLDILWLVNGVIFVVLLFVSGQWMRIVPTSWEVFPNAVSAVIQYISLDWPTENGWVNYNSIQQLTYFLVVFVAAPLAAITGVRMSGIWPKNATRLSAAYPIEWARAVHFPTMIFFVLFIVVHVTLVFATGALRNLNHMYAAQGSTDPTALAGNWAGFWIFVASMVVIAAGWVAARPLVLAPIARLFGTVSAR